MRKIVAIFEEELPPNAKEKEIKIFATLEHHTIEILKIKKLNFWNQLDLKTSSNQKLQRKCKNQT